MIIKRQYLTIAVGYCLVLIVVIGTHTAAKLFPVGAVTPHKLPEICAVIHVYKMCQLVYAYIVDVRL